MKRTVFTFSLIASLLASISYGIVHDQITIRICPEYFTVWHPHLFKTTNLTLLALAWGVLATWWVGLILGCILGAAATIGNSPPATKSSVLKTVFAILGTTGALAAASGALANSVDIPVPSFVEGAEIAERGAQVRHAFATDLVVHNVSYLSAMFLALIGAFLLYRSRDRGGFRTNHLPNS